MTFKVIEFRQHNGEHEFITGFMLYPGDPIPATGDSILYHEIRYRVVHVQFDLDIPTGVIVVHCNKETAASDAI